MVCETARHLPRGVSSSSSTSIPYNANGRHTSSPGLALIEPDSVADSMIDLPLGPTSDSRASNPTASINPSVSMITSTASVPILESNHAGASHCHSLSVPSGSRQTPSSSNPTLLHPEIQHTIDSALKPSTRKSYTAKWKRFSTFAESHSFSPLVSSIEQILQFFLELHHSGLKPSSIKLSSNCLQFPEAILLELSLRLLHSHPEFRLMTSAELLLGRIPALSPSITVSIFRLNGTAPSVELFSSPSYSEDTFPPPLMVEDLALVPTESHSVAFSLAFKFIQLSLDLQSVFKGVCYSTQFCIVCKFDDLSLLYPSIVEVQSCSSRNNTIIQITTLQHEIDQLRRKLDHAKMKLIIEIKMRKQATFDLQALKAELAHKKVQSSLKLQSEK
ncbi:Spermatogenesis-associated protein 1 [Varanus komodoensis]|nr:Spermatogenesis-associated protein 1 [Varanus komodoensis]